jgi:LytS/YehU family sensor histidine kinase
MQLNPHFLFNTLHAISSLMHEDVEAADNMMTGLSDLLRMSLENVNEQEVTLKREMEFLKGYLEIQQTRFRDRLAVRIDVPVESLDALVPNMILQPLVENAVTHGVAPKSLTTEICIRAQKANGTLRLEVADNGKGVPENVKDPSPTGLGLANTTTRLRQLYGEKHRFKIEKGAAGGTVAILEIPFRLAPNPEHQEGLDGDPNDHRG